MKGPLPRDSQRWGLSALIFKVPAATHLAVRDFAEAEGRTISDLLRDGLEPVFQQALEHSQKRKPQSRA